MGFWIDLPMASVYDFQIPNIMLASYDELMVADKIVSTAAKL